MKLQNAEYLGSMLPFLEGDWISRDIVVGSEIRRESQLVGMFQPWKSWDFKVLLKCGTCLLGPDQKSLQGLVRIVSLANPNGTSGLGSDFFWDVLHQVLCRISDYKVGPH